MTDKALSAEPDSCPKGCREWFSHRNGGIRKAPGNTTETKRDKDRLAERREGNILPCENLHGNTYTQGMGKGRKGSPKPQLL